MSHSCASDIVPLRTLELAVTSVCNLRCHHCSAAHGKSIVTPPKLATLQRTIVDAVRIGATSVDLTGGEPVMRADIATIIHFAKRNGIDHVKIHTNGTLLTNDSLTRLRDTGLDALAVSIDGSTADIHAQTRKTSVAEFDRILETIRFAVQLGIAVKINTAVSKNNIDDLPSITALASTLGCYEHRLCLVTPAGRGINWQHHMVNDAEWIEALRRWPTTPMFAEVYVEIPWLPAHIATADKYGCLLSMPRQLHVNANGFVFPCARMSFAGIALGTIHENRIDQLWNDRRRWHRLAQSMCRCCPDVGRTQNTSIGICRCQKIPLKIIRTQTPP